MTLVRDALSFAQKRLVTIQSTATVVDVARLLSRDKTSLVVVCDEHSCMQGVVTKSDVVRQISQCAGSSCTWLVEQIMTHSVFSCQPEQSLRSVWDEMRAKGLKQIPIIDEQGVPLGLLYADEAISLLLNEVENEHDFLFDYVMGVGYR